MKIVEMKQFSVLMYYIWLYMNDKLLTIFIPWAVVSLFRRVGVVARVSLLSAVVVAVVVVPGLSAGVDTVHQVAVGGWQLLVEWSTLLK